MVPVLDPEELKVVGNLKLVAADPWFELSSGSTTTHFLAARFNSAAATRQPHGSSSDPSGILR